MNIWTTTTWSNVWVVLPKPSWYEFLIGFLIWTPASKYLHLTTFSNICVILCSYICNCLKMPKKSQINEYSDMMSTCNRLDLQTLGSRLIIFKILPGHCVCACVYWEVLVVGKSVIWEARSTLQGPVQIWRRVVILSKGKPDPACLSSPVHTTESALEPWG